MVGWNPFRGVVVSRNRMSAPRPKPKATPQRTLAADVR
jgi:hypothetical protein